jgi:trigger factor
VSETSVVVKVEEISPVKTKLLFDVSWDDVKKEMEPIFRKVNKTAKIKGFRQGKVPRNILEMHYGDYVEGETITNLINKFYWDALKTHDILAVSQPEIEQGGIEKDKNFTFTATVEIAPNIEPKGYTGLDLEKLEQDVTESDVEVGLEKLRNMFATMEDIKEERGIKEGDIVGLDFSSSVDGIRREDLEAENFVLEVGSKRFIPGFEEQMIGVLKGETKEICLRLPDDYYVPDIAGKDAVFTFTIKGIKEKILPLLDESFIKNFERYKSLEEMKGDIRKSLVDENNIRSKNFLRNLMITELLKNNEFEVPPSYVEYEFNRIMANMQRRMLADGLSKQEALTMSGKFQDQYRQRAIQTAKVALLMNSIARKESIVVEKNEIEEKIMEISRQSPDFENTVKYFEDEAIRENIKQEILYNKVFEFIEKQSNIKIVKNSDMMIEEENR